MEKTAVVLSGGGAKGAYQLGVWKALRKLRIKYDIVTGTSVGALNGVLMVQKSYYTANKIWRNITFRDIYGKDFEKNVDVENSIDVYKQYVKMFFTDGGMDMPALDKLFGNTININKFKKSKIDFGMIAVNLSTLKPVQMTKEELVNKSLKDYVLASAACFPAIKMKTIDNQDYIDGGYFDNLPINLALSMGATKVIAVDLKAPGIKRNYPKNVEVIRIYPKNKIVSFLVFDKELSRKAIDIGYNDAMKAFNKLDGNKFTFKKNDLRKNYLKCRNNLMTVTRHLYNGDNLLLNAITNFNDFNSILEGKDFSKLCNDIVEYIGKSFEFDETKIYNIKGFNQQLLLEFDKLGPVKKMGEKAMLNTRLIIAYIYNLICDDKLNINKLCKVMVMFRKEFLAALYISAIKIQ